MAPEPYVLDTTVVINLACVDKPVRNRVVAALAEMALVAMEVDEEDDIPMIERGDQLREVISKPFDPPDEHLGEAASAALAERLGGDSRHYADIIAAGRWVDPGATICRC